MTAVPWTAAVDRVNARAAQVDWRRVLLVSLMAIPFLVGAVAWQTVRSVGWLVSWVYAAAVEGWVAAGGPGRRGDG